MVKLKTSASKMNLSSVGGTTTPSVQIVDDTNPGRLTQAKQVDPLIHEDAGETVGEIVDELLKRVIEGWYKADIDRQLAPFSASWAQHYITQIVSQQLLCADKGDDGEEASMTEDPEPSPALPDAWARGCVPVITVTPLPEPALQQQEANNVHSARAGPADDRKPAMAQKFSTQSKPEEEKTPRRPDTSKDCKGPSPHAPAKVEKKKKQQFAIIPKPERGKFLPPLSCSAERKYEMLDSKTGAHFVPNHKTGPCYKSKTHQSIPKLDPSSLPRHYVCPTFEIVDTNCTKSKKPSGLSKVGSEVNKHSTQRTETSPKPLGCSKGQPAKFQRSNEADVFLKESFDHRRKGTVSCGGLRLDKMVLAKGVTLRDREAAEMDPPGLNPPRLLTELKPVHITPVVPPFFVDQVFSGSPRVRPCFSQSTNL